MTTPSGQITLLDVQTEFGGSPPIAINEYYAGAATGYVPAGTAGVPSSGQITLGDLRNKTKASPVQFSVSPSTSVEGQTFFFTMYVDTVLYATVYWKLTDYVNLQDADFQNSSGSTTYSYEDSYYYPQSISTASDSQFEGTGTFQISVYSDSARTNLIGKSSALSLTDTYSIGTITVSRDNIFRYANKNPAPRATVVYVPTSGLEGATIYYQINTLTISGGAVSSSDLDAPTTLTGTITVPAGGTALLVLRTLEWSGNYMNEDKVVNVVFRLNNSVGPYLGVSPNITIWRTPIPSFSFSPTTVREGYTSTLTGTIKYIPLDGECSFFYSTNSYIGTADNTDWLGADGTTSVVSGEIIWSAETLNFYITAKIDEVSEPLESLYFTFRINSTSGTAFWNVPLYIESPAMVIDATATDTTVQINNVSTYPFSRTFSVLFRAKPAASAGAVTGYGSWNTTSSGSSLVVSPGNMTAPAIVYNTNPGGNNGTFDFEVKLSSPGYADYTITRTSSVQTWPIYGFDFTVTGTNANGATRTVYAQITSTPTYPEQRNFVIEYRIKSAGAPENTWTAWTTGFTSTVNVPVNFTYSAFTQIRPPTVAAAQFDVQLRCVLPWNYIRETPVQYGLWL